MAYAVRHITNSVVKPACTSQYQDSKKVMTVFASLQLYKTGCMAMKSIQLCAGLSTQLSSLLTAISEQQHLGCQDHKYVATDQAEEARLRVLPVVKKAIQRGDRAET